MNNINLIIRKELLSIVEEFNSKHKLFISVPVNITSDKTHFTNILKTLDKVGKETKGKIERIDGTRLKDKKSFAYVIYFDSEDQKNKFQEEVLKINPEVIIRDGVNVNV